MENAINRTIPIKLEKKREIAQALKNENNGAKGNAIEAILELNKTFTNDPQNTHDTAVVDQFTFMINKLRDEYPNFQQIDDEYVLNHLKGDAKVNAENIMKNPGQVGSFGITDWDAAKLLIARAHDEKNEKKFPQILMIDLQSVIIEYVQQVKPKEYWIH